MRMMRRSALLSVVPVTLLALAACGTTEDPEPASGEKSGGETITVTDARGQEVELDGPAEDVVGLEWNVVEHLVSLGVQPVGVADVEGYTNWVQAAPLEGEPEDVGVRGEPSLDTIAAMKPDLVLATTDLPDAAISQLEEVAPVVVVQSADAADAIGQMRSNLQLVAEATGTQDRATELLDELDTTLAEGTKALEAAGNAGKSVMFADAWIDGGKVSVRPYAQGSLVGEVTEELGLVNAWTQEGDPAYGLGSTDVEGLTTVQADHFLYISNDSAEEDAFVTGLKGNAVWESLPFVSSGNVHRLPDGIWMFGGPASMAAYVEAVVAELG